MASAWCGALWDKLNRKKTLEKDLLQTPLHRCLSTQHLALIGIGQMVGAGVFVLTGTVIKDKAGPGAILSYLFAGIAALLSSLCYAEFGARVPKAGSAYVYTYITIGEFWAFLVGWNIILEYIVGAAAIARALSGSIDALANNTMSSALEEHLSLPGQFLSQYPDFLSFAFVMSVAVIVALGAKLSANITSVFTVINVTVIVSVAILGFIYADPTTWDSGFLPYGFQGVLGGAASCFFAFIGFDGISIAGEEAESPGRSIPVATISAMIVTTVLYIFVTTSVSFLVPYYDISASAPFPAAFAARGIHWAKYVVGAATVVAIFTALLGNMYMLPRTIYAIASDGLLFRIFAKVNDRTQTPVIANFVFSLVAALMALLLDMETLVDFLSIGTLMAYTMVAASVILLRYQPISECQFELHPDPTDSATDSAGNMAATENGSSSESKPLHHSYSHDDFGKLKKLFRALPVLRHCSPGTAVATSTIIMAAFMAALCSLALYATESILRAEWWTIVLLVILILGTVFSFLVIVAHVQNTAFKTFQIPLVPLLPATSMFINIAMMLKLTYLTWIRLAIWIAVGLVVYFAYGIRNSAENRSLASYNALTSYGGDGQQAPVLRGDDDDDDGDGGAEEGGDGDKWKKSQEEKPEFE
ncbi:cationic amino acid transporter 4 [Lingula anatina]|uniref:Cationic amino acid transporter 4 n=1 Tax=Lingula anatina TaxID=7574 RepID=A0A1S3HC24_LINAN|nr:cationic amino acid transporter 4 [Lingula anatina]|eukprot:XP_013383572.1 cationic amino acid transporter 4 [Lingula anatina]